MKEIWSFYLHVIIKSLSLHLRVPFFPLYLITMEPWLQTFSTLNSGRFRGLKKHRIEYNNNRIMISCETCGRNHVSSVLEMEGATWPLKICYSYSFWDDAGLFSSMFGSLEKLLLLSRTVTSSLMALRCHKGHTRPIMCFRPWACLFRRDLS